ncbi:hypothetical protein [Streptomyces albogriseolus]|uniref:hypothetical protein n=1 Tax=Streptomyces albogriseolus TaxID=1887 RepID=UPI0034601423
MGRKKQQRRSAGEIYAELEETLGDLCGHRPWFQADLYVDSGKRVREAVVYVDDDGGPWDQVGYETGEKPFDVRDGSDASDVIGLLRQLAAAGGDAVRVWRSGDGKVTVYHLPMRAEAYEELVGVGIRANRAA